MRYRSVNRLRFPLFLLIIGFLLLAVSCDQTIICTENVHVALVEPFEEGQIAGNIIEIYALHPDGSIDKEMITSSVTDENGIAHFCLPKGVYRAFPAGSWAGSIDFSLSTDNQELDTRLIVESILN